ncbi:MAG: HDIG domain-containing protein [Bacteroidetes bacterium SB0662_bin_6]|nr:HDIG domain-containing protein [Bacteroidetes bacterium SB0668_bin_1]MYE05259.1 HDIG domain-containing protein [Bacteroidetes bacterium SB0662_bin_6]
MRVLRAIGLRKKKPQPVGNNLEKGLASRDKSGQIHWMYTGGIFFALVLLTVAAFPRSNVYQYTVEIGDEWHGESLVAPFDFSIYKSEAQLEAERTAIRENTPPYFQVSDDAQGVMEANRDTLIQQLDEVFDAWAAYRVHRLLGETEEGEADSLRYLDLRRAARLTITSGQWRLLAEAYALRMPELSGEEPPSNASRPDERLLNEAWSVASQLLVVGVLDVPQDSVLSDQIVVRDDVDRTETIRNKDNTYGLDEAYAFAERQFQQSEDSLSAALGGAFFRAIFTPSLSYLRAETIREFQRLEQRISPVRGRVAEGETIIEDGVRVTEDIYAHLTSFERAWQERGGENILWRVLLGQFLVILAAYFLFFLYLYLLRRPIFASRRSMLLLAILFAIVVGLFAIPLHTESLRMYLVPVAIAPVLITVIFDSRVGIFAALTLALLGGQLLYYNFEFTFATFLASALGVFSVRDIRNRRQFFISAGMVFLGYLLVLAASATFFGEPFRVFFADMLPASISAFLLLLAYPLLWIAERAFGITTDLTLVELSDMNNPLLKQLSLEASGTFNHTLQVANLSEAAADAIGANTLLMRVGALYHDIGKIAKPNYFVENQRSGPNPHDDLKPRMSALIIASHVKEGLEKAREYNVPQRVLDFIAMHHGTSRIEFFYRQALSQRRKGDPEVLESEFRYDGPRPATKETGILMLADSVEAASRSLADPTHRRLETLIDDIVADRLADGQLDDSDLTFRDLAQIKRTFLSMLLGIYHIRIRYPGQEEEEDAGVAAVEEESMSGDAAHTVEEPIVPDGG